MAFLPAPSAGGRGLVAPLLTVTNPRVNAGGPALVDPGGKRWFADYGYNSGYTYSTTAPIAGTDTPALYQSERWFPSAATYTLRVQNGIRTVTSKFAEIYFTQAGPRVFNVDINGSSVLTNLDVFAAAGGANRAVDRSFPLTVTNEYVTITFSNVVTNAKISAIQIQ